LDHGERSDQQDLRVLRDFRGSWVLKVRQEPQDQQVRRDLKEYRAKEDCKARLALKAYKAYLVRKVQLEMKVP